MRFKPYLSQASLYLRSADRVSDKISLALYLAVHVVFRFSGAAPLTAVPVQVAGMRYLLRPAASDHLALQEVVLDRSYFPSPDWVPPPGGWVIDAGANIGTYSTECAKAVGSAGRVDAIEPEPTNFQALTANVRLNRLERVVLPHRIGLWSGSGYGKLTNPGSIGAAWSVLPDDAGPVPLCGLDDVIASCVRPWIDIMKIDTEGAEEEVLRGAPVTLSRTHRVILEYHTSELRSRVSHLLRDAGFRAVFDRELGSSVGIAGYVRAAPDPT